MATITIQVSEEKALQMKEFYNDFLIEDANTYILFAAKIEDCRINMYTSFKCVFQGNNAQDEALIWQDLEDEEKEIASDGYKEINEEFHNWNNLDSHIGSDEVGTGDFFGPVVVCAVYAKKEDLNFIRSLKVQDSKKIKDSDIRLIAPKLMEKLPFSILVLDNETYNTQHRIGKNMNALKAILHNRAYINVIKKANLTNPKIIIDEFANEKLYYSYLKGIKDPIIRNIEFHTKGETYSYSVSCASIIARYRFLTYMDELSSKYNLGSIPKGASKLCDTFGQLFVKTYGIEEFNKIAKMNFVNTQRVLNPLKLDI